MAYLRQGAIEIHNGLAADAKPTSVPPGSECNQLDTSKLFKTKDGTIWYEVNPLYAGEGA